MEPNKTTCVNDEQRRNERIPVSLPVTIRYRGRLIPATALNLSCGGMLLDADCPNINPDGNVELIFDLSAIERDVTLRGRVTRKQAEAARSRIGVEFTSLFTLGHEAVSRYLRRNGAQ